MKNIGKFFRISDKVTVGLVTVALFISIISAVISMVVRAPMTGLDEQSHYARSIQLATGQNIVAKGGDLSQVGGLISRSQVELINRGASTKTNSNTEFKAVGTNWYAKNKDLKFSKEGEFYSNTNSIPYTPFSYFPYVIVAKMSQVFKIRPIDEYVIMRITGFVLYFLLMLLSIRITPIGKVTIAFLLLIPTVTLSFTTVSADGYLLAISTLFLAVLFRIVQSLLNNHRGLSVNNVLSLSIMSLLLVMGKVPIFILVGLLVPILYYLFQKGSDFKRQSLFVGGIIVMAVVVILLWLLTVKDVNTGAFLGRQVDTYKQLQFIISDPIKFFVMLLSSVVRYNYFVYQVGYTNQLEVSSINHLVGLLVPCSLVLSAFIRGNNEGIISKKLFVFELFKYLLGISYILCVFILLYLQFSLIGSSSIDGVQQRYFIPLYLVILSTLTPKRKLSHLTSGIVLILAVVPTVSYITLLINQL